MSLCALAQLGADGSDGAAGMGALRHLILGYLNVSTPDCAPGECAAAHNNPLCGVTHA